MEKRGLGYLAGRFNGKTWNNGTTLVPEEALSHLAAAGLTFSVEGPLNTNRPMRRYEILLPLRFNDGTRVPDELVRGRDRFDSRTLRRSFV